MTGTDTRTAEHVMPKFRFVAVDSEGMLRDGTIDAPDGAAARDTLAANGLRVRELHEEGAAPAADPPLFRRGGPAADDEPAPAARDRGPPGPTPVPPPSRPGTRLLAAGAILLTLFTAVYICVRTPPWGNLSRYDFGTPEAAMRSRLRMDLNGDIQAELEREARVTGKRLREKLGSLKVERTEEADGKTAAFVRYAVTDPATGKEREVKEVYWFRKTGDSGLLAPTGVPPDLPKAHPKLDADIAAWEREQRGGPAPPR